MINQNLVDYQRRKKIVESEVRLYNKMIKEERAKCKHDWSVPQDSQLLKIKVQICPICGDRRTNGD